MLYGPHTTIEGAIEGVRRSNMIRGYWIALVFAGCLAAAPRYFAQTPAGGNGAGTGQSPPPNAGQKPPTAPQQPVANPFPEDTSTVPVMPTKITPGVPDGSYSGGDNGSGSGALPLAGEDLDPVRSPDDPAPDAGGGEDQNWSSSLTGIDRLLPRPEDDQPDKKRKPTEKEPTHQEAASKDLEIGGYYLDRKNWRAALSRFESAMVLDPENPEVYWGLAEAERHIGDFWDARGYYLKLLDYDPDGPHGKQARKAIKDPEIANAKMPVGGQSGAGAVK